MTTSAKRSRNRGNTSGQYSFAQIPSVSVPRSKFDRSCGLKTTFDAGLLIPIFVDEALPGDTLSMTATTFARMATPIHPVMDNLKLDTFFFAVPNRLLWENWERFNGAQDNPDDSTDYICPVVTAGLPATSEGSLSDYFGLPRAMGNVPSNEVTAFHHRAYNKIWNEWFRSETLQDSVVEHTDDGPDPGTDYAVLPRGKRHDYFTSCNPWPQKGPAVELPLGLTAPVVPIPGDNPTMQRIAGDTTISGMGGAGDSPSFIPDLGGAAASTLQWINTGMVTDLSSATAATINQIRQAFQVQKLYEKDARGGTRYTELLRSHFGVTSPDARLQRSEYLGGGTQQMTFSPVPQTSASTATQPVGELAAYATSAGQSPGWIKSFTEHCVIIGMVCVRADLNYQQQTPRMFTRSTRWDFYWPSLAHIGEQAVLNKEVNHVNGLGDNEDVFGYQERWAEYRYKPSLITGAMRSSASASLDTWHLAQDFGNTRPLLNEEFIIENPPVDRVLAVFNQPQFLFDAFFSFHCTRPMPTYSVPGLIDHF